MTNLKKIGLTALAGTLAATTFAQAGELTANGTARMEYSSNESTTSSVSTSADSFLQNTTITFTGSGEMDNGWNVSMMQAITGQAAKSVTSNNVVVDMGDSGVVSMAAHNKAGIGTISDKVPNGGEQPWDDQGTHGGHEDGVASPHTGTRLGYTYDAGTVTLTAASDLAGDGGTHSAAISSSSLIEGLDIGAGMADVQSTEANEDDLETYYLTYTVGSVSIGAQKTKVDAEVAKSDIERDSYGISFVVNENFSIGYGVSETEYDATAKTKDEENTGIGASYTAGGMTIGFVNNSKDNANGGSTDLEMNEIQLTFAF
jgi:outer membrane protein OmpU